MIIFYINRLFFLFFCFTILDHFFIPQYITDYGRITFRLFISYIIFIFIKWLLHKEIHVKYFKIIYILYFLLLVSLSLSRVAYNSNVNNINLRIGYFKDSSKIILLSNIAMYFPIGLFIKKFFPFKAAYDILFFTLYILAIEILQYILKVGYFDINDILLNLLSFIIGLTAYFLLRKKFVFLELDIFKNK